jgi:hypothetical protein
MDTDPIPDQQPLHPDLVQPQPPLLPSASVTLQLRPRNVMVHQVFDYELTALRNASFPIGLTFFGISTGAAASFAAVVFSQGANAKGHDTFVALFVAAVVLSLFFAVWSVRSWWANHVVVREIRERPTAPPV